MAEYDCCIGSQSEQLEIISAGPELIKEDEKVCSAFLTAEAVLLQAAGKAWQFLLIYSHAIEGRDDRREQEKVQATLARISAHQSPQFAWLDNARQLYRNFKAHEDLQSQFTGSANAGRRDRFSQVNADIMDFLVLTRLQSAHTDHLVMDERLFSPYWPRARATQIVSEMPAKLLAFGVQPSDWPRYRSLAARKQLPFSKDALTCIDHIFEDYKETFRKSNFYQEEQNPI